MVDIMGQKEYHLVSRIHPPFQHFNDVLIKVLFDGAHLNMFPHLLQVGEGCPVCYTVH
jgi:hypothetical protein